MASPIVDIVLKAKDEASGAINALGKSIGGLNRVAGALAPVAAGLGAIGAAAGVVGVAAFKMANEFSNTVERLDRLSATTGASIAELQILEQTFKNAGLAPETATAALVKLSKAIGNNDPLLKHLGITTRDSFAAFKQLSDIYEFSTDTSGKVAVAAKLLGREMAASASVVGNLGRELDSTGAKMKAAGALIGEDGAAQARKMDKAMDDLDISIGGVKTQIATALMPAVSDLAALLADTMARNSGAIKGFVSDAVPKLIELGGQILALMGMLRDLANFPPIKLVVEMVGDILDFKGLADDLKRIEISMAAVAVAFKFGEETARAFKQEAMREAGLATFGGFGGGASGGRGGGGAFDMPAPVATPPPGRGGGAVVPPGFVIDADGNLVPEKARIVRLKTIVELLKEAAALGANTGFGLPTALKTPGGVPGMSAPIDEGQIKAWEEETRRVADSVVEIEGAVGRVKEGWLASVEEMTSAATVLDAGFSALFNGLEQGISTVFSRLTDETQTLKSAMKTIFKSIADQALAELARIAAAAIFKWVLKLLLLSNPATAPAAPVVAFVAGLRPERAGIAGVTPASVQRVGGRPDVDVRAIARAVADLAPGGGAADQRTFVIQTLAANDLVSSLLLPGGGLRRAFDRVEMVGAY